MDFETAPDFISISKEIAEKYIQTVVFVDDEAYYPEEEGVVFSIQTPHRITKSDKDDKPRHFKKRQLDVKEILQAFSEKGIICSIIKPDKEEDDPIKLVISSAKRADAFVLDWDIRNDSGDTALKIISKIMEEDDLENKNNPRLRLIILYTGEKDLPEIYSKVSGTLTRIDNRFKLINDEFALRRENLYISLYAKDGTSVLEEYKSKEVTIRELVDRLGADFSELTRGLISNAALFSMSILRDKTGLLLANMGRDLDASFLAHRAMLPNPGDADKQVMEIISSEISSLLDSFEVGKEAGIENIRLWIENADKKDLHNPIETSRSLDKETAKKWEEHGLDKSVNDLNSGVSKNKWKEFVREPHEKMTSVFLGTGGDAFKSDCRFALLTSIKRRYNDMPLPVLQLGTIVSIKNESERFLLCMQPVCDSVRLKGEVVFPFLELEVITEDDKPFNIIIPKEDSFIKVKVLKKPNSLIMHTFSVDGEDDRIRARKENHSLLFQTKKGSKINYIAELKSKHAQRVANEFATYVSRVGLDESEWLRRWSRNENE